VYRAARFWVGVVQCHPGEDPGSVRLSTVAARGWFCEGYSIIHKIYSSPFVLSRWKTLKCVYRVFSELGESFATSLTGDTIAISETSGSSAIIVFALLSLGLFAGLFYAHYLRKKRERDGIYSKYKLPGDPQKIRR